MSEWTDPQYAGVLDAYRAAQEANRYCRPPRSRWGRQPYRWCDGFAMVTDPSTGTVHVAAHGLSSKTD